MSSTTDAEARQARRRGPSATTMRDGAAVAGTLNLRTGLVAEVCTDPIPPRPDEAS